jgi:serine/threonine-protein kinase RsbW
VKRGPEPAKTLAPATDRTRFVRTTAVTASGAAQVGIAFGRWLQRHFSLGVDRLGDVVSAVNEALANAAEFGYRGTPGRGTGGLIACYDDATDTLAVTVTDEGRWRPSLVKTSTAALRCGLRGRGMLLMRAQADEMKIDVSERGTEIRLTWGRLSAPS